ncbi:MAG TPA: DUF2007 domain-containing protein [Bacteroidota bacterium]|nr:DUF2007 domain-containing protein [Bacteroidota bacterium]
MIHCRHCRTEVAESDVLCSSCGAIVLHSEEEEIACENHTGEKAIACCVVCGKPVCGDCATSRENAFLCDIPEHHQVAGMWALAMLAESPFEADMVRANLVHAGIQTRVADPRDFAGTLNFRPHLRVRVLVERSSLESARELLRSFQLMGPES